MVRLIRIVGFLMIGTGALVLLVWAIEPLRWFWPWIRGLPWPIQLGSAVAAGGILLIFGTLIWERIEEREADQQLREEK